MTGELTQRHVEAFFEGASEIYRAHGDQIVAEAQDKLEHYRGLPVAINPFEIVKKSSSEAVLAAALSWLLDPGQPHDLGDSLLRRLLIRCGEGGNALVRSHSPIEALVQCEVALENRRPDIVVLLRQQILSIEVKVDAAESKFKVNGKTWAQTRAYKELWVNEKLRNDAVLSGFGKKAFGLIGASPKILPIYLRKQGREESGDKEETVSLDWMQVEQDLAELARRHDVRTEALCFIQAFRSTLLAGAGATSPQLDRILRLRHLTDLARYGRLDPLTVAIQLGALTRPVDGEPSEEK